MPVTAGSLEPYQTRKTVTVVFSDVSGFTALGERLDPEALRGVMSRYFAEVDAVLQRHGGAVEKFVGDAVMAVFGIPVLHEDDALRAVRAAAALKESLATLNAELSTRWGVALETRTGINTGEVVAGDASRAQAFAAGDAVNVAARLEQAAQPGEILLGEDTLKMVGHAVDVDPVAPLALKGKSTKVAAFRLLGVKPEGVPIPRRLDAPLVGRSDELALLRGAYERSLEERSCRTFTVIGPAGIGKSRLAEEFVTGLEASVLRGRCLPYGEGITFWALAEAVRQAAGIDERDGAESALSKLTSLVLESEHASLINARVGAVLGLATSPMITEEIFWGVRKLFESLASKRSVVVLFDDIQWAEEKFLDFPEYLTGWSKGASIFVLCLARPDLSKLRPEWGRDKPGFDSITLSPLSHADSEKLIENLLYQSDLSGRARGRIIEASEGTPLFLEETVRSLIDDGMLQRRGGRWMEAGDLSSISVPPTIEGLLSARVDGLEPEERAVLQRASVVGQVFWWGAVTELSPEAERPEVGARLQALMRKDFVLPDDSSFAGEDAFRFGHILVRDAAYRALPKATRAELHERFTGWLRRKGGERIAEYEEILGYHLEQAYRSLVDLGPPDAHALELARASAAHLSLSGQRAYARGDHRAAINLLDRAASLMPQAHQDRPGLLLALADVLHSDGELQRAEDAIAEAARAAADSGDRAASAHAAVRRLHLRLFTRPDGVLDSLSEAREVISLFEELGDDLGLCRAWQFLAMGELMRVRLERGRALLRRALVHARRSGDVRQENDIIEGILWSGIGSLTVEESIREHEGEVERLRDTPYSLYESGSLLRLGWLLAMQGRFEDARNHVIRSRAIVQELGIWAPALAHVSGLVELEAGDYAAAESYLRSGYELYRKAGEKTFLVSIATDLGQAIYRQGRFEEAEAFSSIAQEETGRGDLDGQIRWRQLSAKLLARRGRVEKGIALAGEALRLAREAADDLDLRGNALMDVAEVSWLASRPDEAREYALEALGLYERQGHMAAAEKARRVLTALSDTAADP